jgi:hypothetical protein
VLLTTTVVAGGSGTKVTMTWSNAGLHLHSKTIAFAMEYVESSGPVAASSRK